MLLFDGITYLINEMGIKAYDFSDIFAGSLDLTRQIDEAVNYHDQIISDNHDLERSSLW